MGFMVVAMGRTQSSCDVAGRAAGVVGGSWLVQVLPCKQCLRLAEVLES